MRDKLARTSISWGKEIQLRGSELFQHRFSSYNMAVCNSGSQNEGFRAVQNQNLQSSSPSILLLLFFLTLLFTGHDMFTQHKQPFYLILTLLCNIDGHSCFVLLTLDSTMLPIMALYTELRYQTLLTQKDQEESFIWSTPLLVQLGPTIGHLFIVTPKVSKLIEYEKSDP